MTTRPETHAHGPLCEPTPDEPTWCAYHRLQLDPTHSTPGPVQFTGSYDGLPLIADDTDPWVVVDGVPVDWSNSPLPMVACPCDESLTCPLPGVAAPMNTNHGVQRCDDCGTYDGDLDAALALAALVGGTVWYEPATDADLED